MTYRKRALHHPTRRARFTGGFELWEGGGPRRRNWIIKAPGGWMNLATKKACLEWIRSHGGRPLGTGSKVH